MNVRDELAQVSSRLLVLKARIRLEDGLRASVGIDDRKVCTRCCRSRLLCCAFSVVVSYGKNGWPRSARFHSWCNECRSAKKKEQRQTDFNLEMANKLWE